MDAPACRACSFADPRDERREWKKGNGPRLGIVTNRSPSVLRGLQAVLFVMRASILDDEGLQILAFVVETITYRRMFYIGAP